MFVCFLARYMSLPVNVSAILSEFQPKGILSSLLGNQDSVISRISAVESAGPGDLVFMEKKEFLNQVISRRPTAVVTTAALATDLKDFTVLIAPNVALAHALLKQRFGDRNFSKSGWTGVHTSAIVHDSVTLGEGSTVEPRAVIGAGCEIGRRVRVMAGAVIENDVVIGDDCTIHPNALIGYGSRLGNEVVVGPGTILGSEGYGFAQDAKRKSHAIPQTGVVVLEDRVRIGANCCIDRATYHETRIGAGTKLDNLCHVAHNVQIGQDCLITAMFCCAGSSKIGDRVITSGQTGILDHMNICSDSVFLHRAGVTKDVEKPGAYAGLPLQPLAEYLKNSAVVRSANELRKRVGDIEKRLDNPLGENKV